ncbi:MAG: long-chain fatty acid--CoA ligase [Holophagales bacterium]|nr:long-chain fatty acid--CoA ligase [Holophagales bacterium]
MTTTVLHHLKRHAENLPDSPAYGRKVDGAWQTTSWKEYHAQVRRCARALVHLGVPAGGRVAILGNNHPEWAVFCLGAMAARGVPAGIYQTCAPEQVAYILEHAEASVLLVENEGQWQKAEEVLDRLPDLRHVVVMPVGESGGGGWIEEASRVLAAKEDASRQIHRWAELLELGDEADEAEVEARLEAIERDETASFIYTSGTTGRPKAVMLSHGNLVETGRIGNALHDFRHDDCLVSFLPMAHVAEQMLSVHMPAFVAYTVYYAEAPERLPQNLAELQPTIFFAVPRVWERFYAGVQAKLSAAPAPVRAALGAAQRLGRADAEAAGRGERPPLGVRVGWALADRLLVSKLRARMGLANVRVAASGAAPISREILDFFAGLGIRIYEVYGLSETTGPGTWNRAGRTRFGTVGPVIPEVELRIAEDGEILFRGPNIFQGYFKDEAGTAEALDGDGWLHTGDLGQVDDEGFLTITGRKKEILVTSGGKNIAPAGIEGKLKALELVGDAMVVGDNRRFLATVLTLEEEAAESFAETHDLCGDLHTDPKVLAEVERGIRRVNGGLARVEAVRNYRILPARFSCETGELTPTLKLKRAVVVERHADLIEAMYEEGQIIHPDAH